VPAILPLPASYLGLGGVAFPLFATLGSFTVPFFFLPPLGYCNILGRRKDTWHQALRAAQADFPHTTCGPHGIMPPVGHAMVPMQTPLGRHENLPLDIFMGKTTETSMGWPASIPLTSCLLSIHTTPRYRIHNGGEEKNLGLVCLVRCWRPFAIMFLFLPAGYAAARHMRAWRGGTLTGRQRHLWRQTWEAGRREEGGLLGLCLVYSGSGQCSSLCCLCGGTCLLATTP